jgi:hypothetical protein
MASKLLPRPEAIIPSLIGASKRGQEGVREGEIMAREDMDQGKDYKISPKVSK